MSVMYNIVVLLSVPCIVLSSQPCPDIENFKNGSMYKVVDDMGLKRIRFSCNTGLYIRGAEEIFCENGAWSQAIPICQSKKQCNVISPPNDGSYRFSNIDKEGNLQVTITCDKGYVLDEGYDAVIRCDQETAKWSNIVPECKLETDCHPLTAPANGGLKVIEDNIIGYTGLEFFCNPGYEINGESKLYCNGSGSWNYEPPTCEETIACPPVKQPIYGQLKMLGDDRVIFYCDAGYIMKGVSYNQCSKGKWLEAFPTCSKTGGCLMPVLNKGVKVNPKYDSYSERSIISLSCNRRWRMIGSGKMSCKNGKWVGMKPVCIEPTCRMLQPPANGSLITMFDANFLSVGTTLNFTCNANLTMFGKDHCTCTPGYSYYPRWSCRGPVCERNISCPNITEFANGRVAQPFWSREKVPHVYSVLFFYCNIGFEFSDKYYQVRAQAECEPGGRWSTLPKPCVEQPKCPELSLENGVVTLKTGRRSASATFLCNAGYTMVGQAASYFCSWDGTKLYWRGNMPLCYLDTDIYPKPSCGGGFQWTKFFDRDNPSGYCDCETFSDLRKENGGQICHNPVNVEARLTGTKFDYRLARQNVTIDTGKEKGLICWNRANDQGCQDYMIRFCCDIDECRTSNNCHQQATCRNTNGSYTCTCNAGYEGNGISCTEKPKCPELSLENGVVTLKKGKGWASATFLCNTGYTMVGQASNYFCSWHEAKLSWRGNMPLCYLDTDIYPKPSCGAGFQWTKFFDRDDPSGYCDCEIFSDLRKENGGQICHNPVNVEARLTGTKFDYRLARQNVTIDTGKEKGLICWNRANDQACQDYMIRFCCDIDECRSSNQCHQHATCRNTDGSYTCTCNAGFEGNGFSCTETQR